MKKVALLVNIGLCSFLTYARNLSVDERSVRVRAESRSPDRQTTCCHIWQQTWSAARRRSLMTDQPTLNEQRKAYNAMAFEQAAYGTIPSTLLRLAVP